ncbi:MAG: hypothetical protein J0J01_17900 [Reyranella sp.]|uniref:hypothetical protein n=1 Tax=Reyranella sp. TaxID=1929291 RepID=UPI001AC48B6E|nr:hypothetical protein [Reyranella sp.]MBN9088782.1 hypothetical protein [Reyranella sp.]
MTRSLHLMAIGLLALPLAAPAQTWAQAPSLNADRDYCHRLGAIYEHYLGKSYASPYNDYRRGPLSAQVAVTQCDGGDVGQAIAILEDQLKRNKFTLPPRG